MKLLLHIELFLAEHLLFDLGLQEFFLFFSRFLVDYLGILFFVLLVFLDDFFDLLKNISFQLVLLLAELGAR